MKATTSVMTEEKNGFVRKLFTTMPFDFRNSDPSKNYVIHGIELRFVLLRENNAVQFVVTLPVYLQSVQKELFIRHSEPYIQGVDVGYHASKPQYLSQTAFECDLLPSGKCYYDGSTMRAEEWTKIWIVEGNDKIWQLLEEMWTELFGSEKAVC